MNKFSFFFFIFLFLGSSFVFGQDVDQKNKALFDQTVDKLNFRTIEFVYDRKYPRKKFPVTQSNFKIRQEFDDFEGNAAFKKLFLNYNDVSERFKKKFGNGRYDLASFEKGLNDILINKDFEFFISSLTKDDKIMLIKSLQQINKKGVVLFVDANGRPQKTSPDTITETAPVMAAQADSDLSETQASADTVQPLINTAATPEEVFQEKNPRRDWLTWLALVLGGTALAFAVSAKLKDVPDLRSYVNGNFQKKTDGPVVTKVALASPSENGIDPGLKKQLENLTREVEGLYAQMDDLLHKNQVLEQKLAGKNGKAFEVPQTAYFEPETEPVKAIPAPAMQLKPTYQSNTALAEVEEEEAEELALPEYLAEDEAEDAPVVTKLYLSKPDRNGFFWNDEVTRNFTPYQSLFVFTSTENRGRKGTFEIVNDAAQQKLALENPELYLKPVCEISGDLAGGKKLQTESPGTIVLNGDQWVMVKKARVKVV